MDWLNPITQHPWEAVAVLLGLAYVLLAARENLWCWPCALISTAIFTLVFWDVSLLMESALNLYYLLMALYGWWHWSKDKPDGQQLPIQVWSLRKHGLAIGSVALLTLCSGTLLLGRTSAVLPYLDSFTTWASVITTWMVARKVLENWLYWIVIDTVDIVLYLDRGLYLTVALFAFYVALAAYGWFQWRHHYAAQST
jgi:nicotinamide mononucleotide transporter